ncbi:SDR family oxidoreductase [Streptomyces sp. NPDC050619]|uniref:SDR family oxidoreductase n=1 Tax=Streptomyces sp. NPDC050619 TaxID=3157214 RepID=UPI00341D6D5E
MTPGAILTTGGSRGIGAAIASTIAASGRRVAVLSRRRPSPDDQSWAEPAGQPRVDRVEADLADARATNAAIRAWRGSIAEPLDGIVLSAVSYGHGPRHPVLATPLEEWDEVMAVNLRGQFVAVSAVLAELVARPRAMILSVSSTAALESAPGRAHYAASKAGALAFFRALTEELRDTNVSVVQVMPRNQVATPGLAARRPPGFSFEGYDPPTVFDAFVRTALSDLGARFDGALVTVDSDGRWEAARA